MRDRTRRGFLGLGAGLLGATAGCVDADRANAGPTATDRPSGTRTETESGAVGAVATLAFNHAEELRWVDASFPQRDVATYYLALLTGDDHAAFPTARFGNADARAFVAETDFASEAVVVLQDRQNSSYPDLELRSVAVDDAVLAVDAGYPGDGGTDDVTTDTLLLRVAIDEVTLRGVRATVAPQHGGPDRFATANVYDVAPAFDPSGDLVVRNRDCAERAFDLTVTYEGDLFLRESLTLSPTANRRLDGVFTLPGEWRITVRADGESVSETLSLSSGPPGDALVSAAGDGSVSIARRSDGVGDPTATVCETDGYPYESSNPEENLAHPVDLWVLDDSESAHRLTVDIRDGDRSVFSETFETRAGYDKARRAGLLAKRSTYTVEVTADDGTTVTETVTVEGGVSKLTIRVTEAGEVAVSPT